MKWTTLLLAIVIVLANVAAYAQQTRVYDSRGNSIGTVTTTPSGQTTFRDSRGSTTGTATMDSRGTTTFYDSRGSVTGKASGPATFGPRK